MTAVFVHGVPETPAVWSGLLAALGRPDSVALWLPGFDGVRPEGFGATMDEYAAWLVAQLERLDDPVDLVGHDWGGGFVVRVVSTRPELVRSWVSSGSFGSGHRHVRADRGPWRETGGAYWPDVNARGRAAR